MAITRRQFLKCSGLAAAGSVLGPSLFANPFLQRALAAIQDRYFVVIFLDGGNDGLNTVVPAGAGALRDAYDAARSASASGGLRLSAGALSGTLIGNDPSSGTQLALHPGLYYPATPNGVPVSDSMTVPPQRLHVARSITWPGRRRSGARWGRWQ